jgi:hypothetical protein
LLRRFILSFPQQVFIYVYMFISVITFFRENVTRVARRGMFAQGLPRAVLVLFSVLLMTFSSCKDDKEMGTADLLVGGYWRGESASSLETKNCFPGSTLEFSSEGTVSEFDKCSGSSTKTIFQWSLSGSLLIFTPPNEEKPQARVYRIYYIDATKLLLSHDGSTYEYQKR